MIQLRQLLVLGLLTGAVLGGLCAAEAGAGGRDASAAPKSTVRVVSQTVGTDELLLALAEPGQIAALSHLSRDPSFSAVAEEASRHPNLKQVGDAESVLQYKPTLVLFANYSRSELVTQVKRMGVPVLIFERYETMADVYANLRMLAAAIGAGEKAERLIASCEARRAALRERLKGRRPVRVLAPSTYGLVPGAATTFQDLCDHACAENLAATLGGLKGHAPPPAEKMLLWPIERLVVAGDAVSEALNAYRLLPGYAHMPAVLEKRAVLIRPYMLSCVSHHRIEGYEMLARALHPDAFPGGPGTGKERAPW